MKNTLIISNCNKSIPLIIDALEKNEDEVSVISGYQPYIVHPYDSLLRTIVKSTHQYDTEEVIFVSVKDQNKDQDKFDWTASNRTKQSIDLLNYTLNNQQTDFGNWLEEHDEDEILRKSINYLKKHPLLPANVKVKGMIWEDDTIRETAS
ncbi:carbonic anhydrase [Alkalihalobacterium elongatum]|uniref:hypothetical protein n=1 Tax=Alkalihalobacterium elongatum TaxID=2675466 RepID=UPI001C1F9149|nr:hypothetical protein [Alkalihalobacterium elongatum]